jgi:hypothetical protein
LVFQEYSLKVAVAKSSNIVTSHRSNPPRRSPVTMRWSSGHSPGVATIEENSYIWRSIGDFAQEVGYFNIQDPSKITFRADVKIDWHEKLIPPLFARAIFLQR